MHTHDDMIADIVRNVAQTRSITGKDQLSHEVISAIKAIERAQFVPKDVSKLAYSDCPLQIGHGQTISQPFIVALMTDMLDLKPDHKVLEIGTGSGYQTAVLSHLVSKVYSVERIADLSYQAQQRLQLLNYNNVDFYLGDGHEGWIAHAPYDAIIVTAAATSVPPKLLEQLKTDGNMVIPVGLNYMPQQLLVISKDKQGNIKSKKILDVSFVPLVAPLHND